MNHKVSHRWGVRARFVAVVVLVSALVSCASAPPETFYALASASRSPLVPSRTFARSVVVGRASLPDSIDRPQFVTVADGNRNVIWEQQRWAEPLRVAISRVVADDLATLLGSWQVSSNEDVIHAPDCRVNLDVRRFDARLGVGVDLHGLWTATCAGGPARTGRTTVHQATPIATFPALVVAASAALEVMSGDIAKSLLYTESSARVGASTMLERRIAPPLL